MSTEPIRQAAMPEIESHDTAQVTCPYYRQVAGARCVSGCWEEPSCQVDEPVGGWKPRDRNGRFITLTDEQLDAMASERWAAHVERWPHLVAGPEPVVSFEQKHFGREITCRGVYQAFDGRWFAYDFEGNFRTFRTRAYDSELDARRELLRHYMFADRFGWQMWAWMEAGDCAPRDGVLTGQQQRVVGGIPASRRGRRNVLRVDGCHYIPSRIDQRSHGPLLGFGGREFRWRWLDEPEGTVHFSNDVFTQGDVPAKMRHLLPDNAVFVTEPETVRCV